MYIKKTIGLKFRKFNLNKIKIKICKLKSLFKFFLILSLLVNKYEYYYFNKKGINITNEPTIRIFIMTHKDFKNYRYNPAYNIVFNGKNEPKEKYDLNIILANNTRLSKMNRAYGEMSQLYYIYQLYKKGALSSKYIGLNHYSKYFSFLDDLPDFDDIFKNYDVILLYPYRADRYGMKHQFCRAHICSAYYQIIEIIKEIKPEYYKAAINTMTKKEIYLKNLFIMKKEDFLKFCEFQYDVLFEFDRRNNLTSDEDVLKFVNNKINDNKNPIFQSRLQGFLSERLSNMFYYKHFKKIKYYSTRYTRNSKTKKNKAILNKILINRKRIKKAKMAFLIHWIINIALIFIFLFFYCIKL